jgi:hypothetical protein
MSNLFREKLRVVSKKQVGGASDQGVRLSSIWHYKQLEIVCIKLQSLESLENRLTIFELLALLK